MFPKQTPQPCQQDKIMLLQCCVRDESKFLLQNRRFQPPAHLATINYLKKKKKSIMDI